MEELLKNTPPFVWTLGVFAALLLARELGNRLARRIRVNDEIEQGHVISGVLGLLALLIAFTFGMALNRYEARGDLMVKEANAIATAAMRVRMLEPPHAARLGGLHREYADMRVRYGLMTADKKLPLREASRALRARIQTDVLQTLAPIRETALSASIHTSSWKAGSSPTPANGKSSSTAVPCSITAPSVLRRVAACAWLDWRPMQECSTPAPAG